MHIIFLILTGVLAAIFAASGMAKVLNVAFARGSAEHFGIDTTVSRAIGLAEVVAVAGLLAGISIKQVSIVTAIGIIALMVGAVGFHVRAKDKPAKLLPAIVTGAFALALVYVAISAAH
jgi:hypothetical protein